MRGQRWEAGLRKAEAQETLHVPNLELRTLVWVLVRGLKLSYQNRDL